MRNNNLRMVVLAALFVAARGAAAESPSELAGRARDLARAGSSAQALELYRTALAAAPSDVEIRRDYAIVLGWAEKYSESIAEFQKILQQEPDQPDWALRELARSYLYGGSPEECLRILDGLLLAHDDSEATLCRKAFALRWLNRAGEAEVIYRRVAQAYPDSTTAQLGMIYSLADQDRLERALAAADAALARTPGNWELLKAKAQVFNWMGRHRAAMRILDTIPGDHANDREILEGRIAAARWGGQPAVARRTAGALAAALPGNPGVARLKRDVFLEYGRTIAPTFRYASDTDGFIDRLFEQSFALHAGAAHRFQFGFQNRSFTMDEPAGWRRFDLGWSGYLSRRVTGSASVSDIEYTATAAGRRFVGDAGLSFAAGDRLKLSAGGGSIAADAYRAVRSRITAPFFYGNILAQPSRNVLFETQYSRYMFSNGVDRDRLTVEGYRRLAGVRRLRLDAGGAANWMRHNGETPDFFSPSSYVSVLAKMRASGRFSNRFEYVLDAGAGAQREAGYRRQSPFALSGSLFARLSSRLHLRIEAGRTTSSLERMNPGRAPYSRTVVSASLLFRFE